MDFKEKLNEKKLDLGAIKGPTKDAEERMGEAMAIYDKVAQVFIDERVDLPMSYMVLVAMADAVFMYMTQGHDPSVKFSKDNL